jgi:polysaccharide deacetylase 2 family uncharacterized protein YibQ
MTKAKEYMLKKTSALLNFKPNPARQAILVGLALVGIGIGYGMGFVLKKDTPATSQKISTHETPAHAKDQNIQPKIAEPQPVPKAKTIHPEPHQSDDKPRAYEEALPKRLVEYPAITIPPIIETKSAPNFVPIQQAPKSKAEEPTSLLPKQPDATVVQLAQIGPDTKKPHWLKNALPVNLSNKPKIAIVLDDMGVDQRRSRIATQLKGPLTLSYLTYARDLAHQTQQARTAGHELMLHVPMEPSSSDVDPGPNVLLSGVPTSETIAALKWGLEQFSGFIGINNHMGSRFTSNLEGMRTVMQELKKRELVFLDSVTSGSTKGQIAANQIGVPFIARNIFLDHIDDINEIKNRLSDVKRLAKKQGYAIAIGHPRDATLKALKSWLEENDMDNFQLVPISALIQLVSMPKIEAIPSTQTKAQ